MVEVRLEGIRKRHGGREVLHGIDLAVHGGEFLTLVGPSGCGKSTLLHIVAGLDEPSEGRILFDGVDVTERTPRERDVALVFQSYALYPHLRVFENLAFPLRMARMPRDEIRRRVEETAELLRIRDLLPRRPRELSGGERQRVALGRAIVRRPRLFLFDEPLSNLDASLRLAMRAELKRLHGDLSGTFVYVTHDQVEAMTLAGRLAVLRSGELLQAGPPEEVYRTPADTFVATFLGSPPMNLLRVRVRAGEAALDIGESAIPWPRESLPRVDGAREVVLGVRPEHLLALPSVDGAPLRGKVSLVEPIGSESFVHATAAGTEVVLRVPPDRRFEPGDAIGLGFAPEQANFFDARSGKRLS